MKEITKDNLYVVGVIALGFLGIAGLFYLMYLSDIPVEKEGKVIGTFVEASGWSSRSLCIVEIDGERYNTSTRCDLIVGDKVKVNKYKHTVLIIERIK